MADISLNDVLNGNAEAAPVAPAAPSEAGPKRERTKVAAGGSNGIELEVGDKFEGLYGGFTPIEGKYIDPATKQKKTSPLHSFTLSAPATLTKVTKEEGASQKTKTRTAFEAGTVVTLFGKGNFNYLCNSVPTGADVEVIRLADEAMKSGPYAGQMVHTYEVWA